MAFTFLNLDMIVCPVAIEDSFFFKSYANIYTRWLHQLFFSMNEFNFILSKNNGMVNFMCSYMLR